MKNILKISAVLLALAMAFSSCTKVQSSMSIDDIPYKATVKGCLVYDMGQGYSNGKYIQQINPAAGVKVIVRVENSQLDPKGQAQGYTVYADTTDANGIYEIEVPSTSNGVEVKVKPETFTGKYYEVESIQNGAPVMKETEVYYEVNEKTISIIPGDLAVCDGVYTCNERSAFEKFDYNVRLQVMVGKNSYSKKYDKDKSKYVIEKKYVAANNVDLTIDGYYSSGVKTFMATTNNSGYATFTIPSKERVWDASVRVEARTFGVSEFTYMAEEYDDKVGKYVVNEYTIEGGTFEQFTPSSNSYRTITLYGSDEVFVANQKVAMVFEPYVSSEDFGYSSYEWNYISF